jgi:hypothetical protein
LLVHLAGRLAVDLTDAFTAREYIILSGDAAEFTSAGTRFLAEFGIDLSALSSTRHRFCKVCIDWTERRPHIAGPVGAALTKRYFDLGWIERVTDSRAVIVTAAGKRGFSDIFGIGLLDGGGTHTQRPAQRQLDSALPS